jgi:hypothetical protein
VQKAAWAETTMKIRAVVGLTGIRSVEFVVSPLVVFLGYGLAAVRPGWLAVGGCR